MVLPLSLAPAKGKDILPLIVRVAAASSFRPMPSASQHVQTFAPAFALAFALKFGSADSADDSAPAAAESTVLPPGISKHEGL